MRKTFLLTIGYLIIATSQVSAQQMETFARHRKLCDLPSEVIESSGLAIIHPNLIWTHGDSGTKNEIFQTDTTGKLIRKIQVLNAPNTDWEDMCLDKDGNIWINDAGNNSNSRTDLHMYRILAPHLHDSTEVHAEVLAFTFSDQSEFPPPRERRNFDVEGIFFWNDSLHLFTKDRSNPFTGYTRRYILPAAPGIHTAQLIDSFFIAFSTQLGRITAADISDDGSKIALLSLRQVIIFSNFKGTDFFKGDVSYYPFEAPTDQIEAIGFVEENRLYITDEGTRTVPGALYEVNLESREKTGINGLFANKHGVYYNHAMGGFLISESDEFNEVIVKLYDASGRTIPITKEDQKFLKPTNRLVPGVYFLSMENQGQLGCIRITVGVH